MSARTRRTAPLLATAALAAVGALATVVAPPAHAAVPAPVHQHAGACAVSAPC